MTPRNRDVDMSAKRSHSALNMKPQAANGVYITHKTRVSPTQGLGVYCLGFRVSGLGFSGFRV